ncbi:MAG: hypothetical protein IJS74_01895 [Clostridia bacterium]|nr:hypothetical protein [Clostridia bacterium]
MEPRNYAVIIVFDKDPVTGKYKDTPRTTILNKNIKNNFNTPLDLLKDGQIIEPALSNDYYVYATNTDTTLGKTTIVRKERLTGGIITIANVNFNDQYLKKVELNNQLIYTGIIYSTPDTDSLREAINAKVPCKANDPYGNREFTLIGDGRSPEPGDDD